MKYFIYLFGALLFWSCNSISESPFQEWAEKGEALSGGEATVFDASVHAFGNAAPNLEGDKSLLFVSGNAIFKRNWVTAPASTEDLDGLGPVFNARSCSTCHALDGRGAPPESAFENPVGLLFRLSSPHPVTWEPAPDPNYGSQFNTLSVLGVDREGEVRVLYGEKKGQYADGTSYSLRVPDYQFVDLNYGYFSENMMVSPRIAPHMVGLGLLEAIPEATILALADEEDKNGDGISGKANYIQDFTTGKMAIGRFGWKANQPSVRQQVAGAFLGDIGITTSIFNSEPCAELQQDCQSAQNGGTPELPDPILDRVVLYSAALAVPGRRDWDTPKVLQGKALFHNANCQSCHIPKLVTEATLEFPEFGNQIIRPYTDLLLHDMGDGLADNRPDGLATGREWKTPPLWGIGLIPLVNGHSYLLHDGRARNIEEAILWHNGEAKNSKKTFMAYNKEERESLITFIKSL